MKPKSVVREQLFSHKDASSTPQIICVLALSILAAWLLAEPLAKGILHAFHG